MIWQIKNLKELKGYQRDTVHLMFSITHESQKVEATQVPHYLIGWMDKQKMVYTYNGIVFSPEKEEKCYDMGEPGGHCVEWNKPVTKRINTVWSHLHAVSEIVKRIEIEGEMVVARGCGEGRWGCCLMGLEFQVYRMKKVCWVIAQ